MTDTVAEPPNTTTLATGPAAAATRETLEDYTLRFAPRSYRKWGPGVVAISALGGIAYLADFAIGATSASPTAPATRCGHPVLRDRRRAHRLPARVLRGAVQHRPRPDHARKRIRVLRLGRHQRDLRVVHFIFFALEGSIMAQGLKLGLHIPLWLGYLLSSVLIIPLVITA